MGLMFSLRLISDVELKSVAERAPVDGLNVSFVEETLMLLLVPEVTSSNIWKYSY